MNPDMTNFINDDSLMNFTEFLEIQQFILDNYKSMPFNKNLAMWFKKVNVSEIFKNLFKLLMLNESATNSMKILFKKHKHRTPEFEAYVYRILLAAFMYEKSEFDRKVWLCTESKLESLTFKTIESEGCFYIIYIYRIVDDEKILIGFKIGITESIQQRIYNYITNDLFTIIQYYQDYLINSTKNENITLNPDEFKFVMFYSDKVKNIDYVEKTFKSDEILKPLFHKNISTDSQTESIFKNITDAEIRLKQIQLVNKIELNNMRELKINNKKSK